MEPAGVTRLLFCGLRNKQMTFKDPVAKPGEYLLVHTHANWSVSSPDTSGSVSTRMNAKTIDVYVPGNRDEEWVLDRDWGDMSPAPMDNGVIRAKDGRHTAIDYPSCG